MWDALYEICQRETRTIHDVCTMIDTRRGEAGLTASLRVFILTYFRQAAVVSGLAEGYAPPPTPPRVPSPLVRAALEACWPDRN